MDLFNGKQYLAIDVANNYGLDKLTWNERLNWFKTNENKLDTLEGNILFKKSVKEWFSVKAGNPSGYPVAFDATSSGLQVMGVMSGCETTCKNTNIINTSQREDIYSKVAYKMSNYTGLTIDRDTLKKPIMTFFYGSKKKPKEVFGEGELLNIFYLVLKQELPGAMELMEYMQAAWDPTALRYEWVLPDGHVASFNVMSTVEVDYDIEELAGKTFTHRVKINKPIEKGLSLAANIVHSIDAYIVREMIRRANKQGFRLSTIHDSFHFIPNYGNQVRQNYNNILSELAVSNIFADIMSQIYRRPLTYTKRTANIADFSSKIQNANYALS